MARVNTGQTGQHPDNRSLSGDNLPGQTRTPPYKGVQLSGCPDTAAGDVKKRQTKRGRYPSTSNDWTTRVLPDLTRQYGVEELHHAWFTPKGWPGKGSAVSLMIPECELQIVVSADDGEPLAIVNRPTINRNIKGWVRKACDTARTMGASVGFCCDTAAQVEHAAKLASKLLPTHERTALERMYSASTRARASLN